MTATTRSLPAIAFLLTLLPALFAAPPAVAQDKQLQTEVWFRCEFAHSRIAPDDDCRMLDDDGFMLVKGVIYHVKVSDSEQTGCRGQRAGQCFLKTRPEITVDGSEIGPIKRSDGGFSSCCS